MLGELSVGAAKLTRMTSRPPAHPSRALKVCTLCERTSEVPHSALGRADRWRCVCRYAQAADCGCS